MKMLMVLKQHRVSSSKTVRHRAPWGARYMKYTVKMWYAVYSMAPYSQFGEGARSHFSMDKWNCPIPIRRRLSLTQAVRGQPISTGLALLFVMYL